MGLEPTISEWEAAMLPSRPRHHNNLQDDLDKIYYFAISFILSQYYRLLSYSYYRFHYHNSIAILEGLVTMPDLDISNF